MAIGPLAPSARAEAIESPQFALSNARELFTQNSPRWLEAVGKLQVPGIKFEQGLQRHHREDCSATLVGRAGSAQANTIVTAWHCLEFYKDLSKAIVFTLRNGTQQSFSIEARLLADGGSMQADWAVLRLQKSVPSHKLAALQLKPKSLNTFQSITMAGYSNDGKNSEFGQTLSYHSRCNILSPAASGNGASDCIAMKGASGGAVIQMSNNGRAELAGVISQGNGLDFSEYVSVEKFRLVVMAYW